MLLIIVKFMYENEMSDADELKLILLKASISSDIHFFRAERTQKCIPGSHVIK